MIPQHLIALEHANEIRFARARLRAGLAAGTVTVAGALDAECAQTMTLIDLLMSQHRWGRQRALRALGHVGAVSERRRIGDLTDRQRGLLLLALDITTSNRSVA